MQPLRVVSYGVARAAGLPGSQRQGLTFGRLRRLLQQCILASRTTARHSPDRGAVGNGFSHSTAHAGPVRSPASGRYRRLGGSRLRQTELSALDTVQRRYVRGGGMLQCRRHARPAVCRGQRTEVAAALEILRSASSASATACRVAEPCRRCRPPRHLQPGLGGLSEACAGLRTGTRCYIGAHDLESCRSSVALET